MSPNPFTFFWDSPKRIKIIDPIEYPQTHYQVEN